MIEEKRINEDSVIIIANKMIGDFVSRISSDAEMPDIISPMEIHLAGIVATREIERQIAEEADEIPMPLGMYFDEMRRNYLQFQKQCREEE